MTSLAMAAAVSLTLVTGQVVHRWWDGEPYPVADPVAAARRLDARTQAVYEVLGLPRAAVDGGWPGREFEASGYDCQPRGMRHWPEGLRDSPTSAPGVVDVRAAWGLKGVTRAQAEGALQRVRTVMTRRGWRTAEYRNEGDSLWLKLKPADSEDTVALEWYPAGLEVAASSPCARYPSGTEVDQLGHPVLPPQEAPLVRG
ncbi:hypothetical protein [Streptomyces orinoci]|uniref:Uncharacterized protein n=1 Tax=Streptomyces orinoci TaxID=67339 RepID=A0ABV3K2A4_STRON|nr:hypothetical protein [Streptomyces orinoci]